MHQSRKEQRVASAGLCDHNVALSTSESPIPHNCFFHTVGSQTAIGARFATCMHGLPLCQALACPFARVKLAHQLLAFFAVACFSCLSTLSLVTTFSRRELKSQRG